MRRIGHFIILLFMLAVSNQVFAETGEISLDDAIRYAMENNHEIKAYHSAVAAAEASRKQARGHYGPVLKLSSNLLVWDDETTLSLGSGDDSLSQLPAPVTPYETAFMGLVDSLSEPTKIQDQITSETKVMLAMPLNPLYQIHQGYEIASLERDVAKSELDGTSQNTVMDVVTAYFGVLQAKKQQEIAEKSLHALDEQARVVKAFFEQGMMAKNDLLKIRVARADAHQKQIKAKAMSELASANLATVMGLPTRTDLKTVPFPAKAPAGLTISLEEASAQAIERRPEITQVTYRGEQADRGRKAAIAQMFPNLSLVGAYTHSEGVEMGRADTFFGGVMLDWDAFEWGATYYGIDKAKEERNRAEHMKNHIESLIRLQLVKADTEFRTAIETLKVADAAAAEAQESYDIEAQNIARGMGTTADMLEAEASLVRAENNRASATYACYVAKAAFLKAAGETIRSDNL